MVSREGRVGVVGGDGGEKTPQVKTQGHQSPSNGLDRSTRPKGHHSVEGRILGCNWCTPQVPMWQLWFYKAVNPPLRKADQLSLAMGDMLCK